MDAPDFATVRDLLVPVSSAVAAASGVYWRLVGRVCAATDDAREAQAMNQTTMGHVRALETRLGEHDVKIARNDEKLEAMGRQLDRIETAVVRLSERLLDRP